MLKGIQMCRYYTEYINEPNHYSNLSIYLNPAYRWCLQCVDRDARKDTMDRGPEKKARGYEQDRGRIQSTYDLAKPRFDAKEDERQLSPCSEYKSSFKPQRVTD